MAQNNYTWEVYALKKILILALTAIILCTAIFALSSCFGSNSNDGDDDDSVHTHTMGEWKTEVAATCTEDGKQYRTCTGDGCNHKETKVILATGHNIIHHEGQAPGCTEPGFKPYDTCSGCLLNTYEEIDPIGHSYTQGNGDVCDNCSQKHVHVTYGDWYTPAGQDATCTDKGLQERKCDGCNYIEQKTTDKLPHDIGEDGKCTECGGTNEGIYLPEEEF